MKSISTIKLLLLISFLMTSINFVSAQDEKKPNILFFLVDDLGWADVGYNGTQTYETPNIDKLASQGVQFSNAYVTHPRCVPSRYSIYTGKYPTRSKYPGPGKMELSEYTIAEAFKDAGYSTFFTGKWHLSQRDISYPDNQGFDINIGGGKAGAPISYFHPFNEPPHHQFKNTIKGLDEGVKGEYLTDRLTNETISYLKQHIKNKPEQPFFAVVSHYAVHEPLEAKEVDEKKFQKIIDKTKFVQPEYVNESNGKTKMRQDNAAYAGMVYAMDKSLGRILKALKDLKVDENTIIVFFSDNGGLSNTGTEERLLATSNYPLRAGKGHLYEGGIRVPMIVKLPKQKNGKVSDAVVTGADFYPTLLELSNINLYPEQHQDGESFAWALHNKKNPNPERPVFWHNGVARPLRTGDYYSTAVIRGKYKLIDFYRQNRVELYDLSKDMKEENNLAVKLPDLTKELHNLVKKWRIDIDAYNQPIDKKTKWE